MRPGKRPPMVGVPLLALLLGCGSGGAGPGGGEPGWQERAVLALTNAVRIAPADWKARWSGGGLGGGVLDGYPAVPPVRWNAALGESSRAHSIDMAVTPCFQHDSCSGTPWNQRIASYYRLSGAIGENIAAGYQDPEAVVFGWICEGSAGGCPVDGQNDGHRQNIMRAGWEALGVGWAAIAAGPYSQYWTEDFGGKAEPSAAASPLVDGSHLLRPGNAIRFFANFYGGAAPASLSLVLEGAPRAMALALGTAAKGTYALDLPASAGCRSYRFEAVDGSGAAWRFPLTGQLVTQGEGTCTTGFAP